MRVDILYMDVYIYTYTRQELSRSLRGSARCWLTRQNRTRYCQNRTRTISCHGILFLSVDFLWNTDSGLSKDTGMTNNPPSQTLGVNSAIVPIGELTSLCPHPLQET